MANGKLPNEDLQDLLSRIRKKRPEVLLGAKIGTDCAVLDFGGDWMALSTDPITGATENIGHLAIEVSINDVATTGAEPIAALLSILVPEGTSQSEIDRIMQDAADAAANRQIEICGGHTEITDAVVRPIVQTTVIGRVHPDCFPQKDKIKIGDAVYVTKMLGLEAAAILAADFPEQIKAIVGAEGHKKMLLCTESLSVLQEGLLAAGSVHYMHDVTEGGLYGALYEASMAIGKGIYVDKRRVPVFDVMQDLCEALNCDIFRMISSGSMLMIGPDQEDILKKFQKAKIPLARIGEVTADGIMVGDGTVTTKISPPERDELYHARRKLGGQE